MNKKTDKQIGDAVKECLNRCYTSGNTPLGAIVQYLSDLRRQGWSDEDVRIVEQSARKLLVGIVRRNSDSDSARE